MAASQISPSGSSVASAPKRWRTGSARRSRPLPRRQELQRLHEPGRTSSDHRRSPLAAAPSSLGDLLPGLITDGLDPLMLVWPELIGHVHRAQVSLEHLLPEIIVLHAMQINLCGRNILVAQQSRDVRQGNTGAKTVGRIGVPEDMQPALSALGNGGAGRRLPFADD